MIVWELVPKAALLFAVSSFIIAICYACILFAIASNFWGKAFIFTCGVGHIWMPIIMLLVIPFCVMSIMELFLLNVMAEYDISAARLKEIFKDTIYQSKSSILLIISWWWLAIWEMVTALCSIKAVYEGEI